MSVCWYDLKGNCMVSTVVYQATVSTKTETNKKCTGITEKSFKERYYNHNQDLEISRGDILLPLQIIF